MGVTVRLPAIIGPAVGLLTDVDIRAALSAGFLFQDGTYAVENAKYASYEIRVGPLFEVLRFEGSMVSHLPKEIGQDDVIPIPPGATVLITAEEMFRIPTDVFAKVTTVGQIFASGLAAENTFADPGYDGPLYVTVSNISTRTLSLKKGDPLGRVEFHRLSQPVGKPHPGYQGRRPSFVRAMVDTTTMNLLRDRSIRELLDEMVSRSLDEALHQRFARSEVLIEKAHHEIDNLRLIQSALRRLRYLSAALVAIALLILIRHFNLLGGLRVGEGLKFASEVVAAILGGALWSFIEKKLLARVR
jgi:deoxycytidine triphosphate deaminase